MLQDPPTHSPTTDRRLVTALRQMILDGRLAAGAKISEVRVSEMFDVSRTPARLALRALEVEGLIRKREGRGFCVVHFSQDDLRQAYEVRGVLEGLAAGTLARVGLAPGEARALAAVVDDIDAILGRDTPMDATVVAYQDANTAFHTGLIAACDNAAIAMALARVETLPLVGVSTVVYNADRADRERARLRMANMQHRVILDAIARRDSLRAEALMREHAHQVPIYTALFVAQSDREG